ncbi:MAG: superoxide dismutase [Acidimicrobiales bacterium]
MAATVLLSPSAVSAQGVLPDVIPLPAGWQPEGIARGRGTTMFSGSLDSGDVVAVDALTGASRRVVDAPAGRTAVGLKQDHWGRLWVAGGPTGQAYLYESDGAPVTTFSLGSPPSTFINDVVITREAAWFTDSLDGVLYRIPIGPNGSLGAAVAVPLTGGYEHAAGFNLNGIDAAGGNRWLIAVQSNTGTLYRIDSRTGAATSVDLGGASLARGDGLLLLGRRLYVVQSGFNLVSVVDLDSPDFASGRVVGELTSPNFDIPTTIASLGNRLYLVNSRFLTTPTPTTPYTMVAIQRR